MTFSAVRGFYVLRIVGSDLYHCGWAVGKIAGDAVRGAQAGVAAIDMGAAVFTAEYSSLGENTQPIKRGGTIGADDVFRYSRSV